MKLTGQSNSTRSTFYLNPSYAINWIDSEEELLRVAKGCYNCDDGLFKWLEVELAIDYIETIEQ